MALADWLHNERIFLQFGGQGSPYLKEMSDLFHKQEKLHNYFETIFQALEEEMARERVQNSPALPQGLDIRSWVADNHKAPEESYLSAASVSIPLIGLTQLANYFLLIENGISGKQILHNCAGVTGHSQGLIPAVLVGLGFEGEDLYHHAAQYIKYLLYLGISSQEAYGDLDIGDEARAKVAELGDKDITPMVAVIGPNADHLQEMIDEVNPSLPENQKIYLSLRNTAESNVISSMPMSLLRFREIHKAMMDENKWKFIPIKTTAAFHSPMMDGSEEIMQKEIDRMSFSYKGAQLQAPVYSIHDGRNLQNDDELALVMFREMVMQVLHWDKAVHTLREDTQIRYVVDFGPSKVSARLTGGHLSDLENPPQVYSLSNPKDLKNIFVD